MNEVKDSNVSMRLAFRTEGEWWTAYAAKINTMEGALELGRIKFNIASKNVKYKEAFIDFMKMVFNDFVKDVFGASVEKWTERSAPEHEKAGRA